MSHLNPMKVRVIRRCCEFGVPQRYTAAVFGVGQQAISKIHRRVNWKEPSIGVTVEGQP